MTLPHELQLGAPASGTAAGLRMRLWTMDARVRDPSVLVDGEHLRRTLHHAAAAGGATVLGEEFCVFANGAVTGVLVLAQSHLSLHTWPELSLANVDLLTYGDMPGEEILRTVERGIGAERCEIRCMTRAPW